MGGLYKIDVTNKSHHVLTSTTMTTKVFWHQRYGHLNYHDLLLLEKQGMVDGIRLLNNKYLTCEGCVLGKMHREGFPTHTNRRERDILELLHTNVCGPMKTRSLGGAYYFLIFVDDCKKYS